MKLASTLLALVVFAVGAAASRPADAKSYTIGDPPVAVITLPDTWKPREYDGGVEANAPDGGAYLAVEAVKVKDVATATQEGIAYFQKNGVVIDPATMAKRDTTIAGLPAVDVTWKGKDKDGPTNVSLTFVIMSETQSVLFYLWASDDDMRAALPQLKEISDSLKKVG